MRVGVIWEELIIMVALPNECFYKRGYSLVISASLSFHCEPFTHYQLLFIHRVFLSVCASERLLSSWLMIEIRVMVVRLTGQTYLLPLLSMILRRQFDVLEPAACWVSKYVLLSWSGGQYRSSEWLALIVVMADEKQSLLGTSSASPSYTPIYQEKTQTKSFVRRWFIFTHPHNTHMHSLVTHTYRSHTLPTHVRSSHTPSYTTHTPPSHKLSWKLEYLDLYIHCVFIQK